MHVHLRLGHDECPSTIYKTGVHWNTGGLYYDQFGSRSNPQCLQLDPPIYRALMCGGEYEIYTNNNSYIHGHHDTNVPCTVCHISNHITI